MVAVLWVLAGERDERDWAGGSRSSQVVGTGREAAAAGDSVVAGAGVWWCLVVVFRCVWGSVLPFFVVVWVGLVGGVSLWWSWLVVGWWCWVCVVILLASQDLRSPSW